MKDCNKVFFAEKGLTSTSANHLANLAREEVATLQGEIAAISFINEFTSTLGGNQTQTKIGKGENFLSNIESQLDAIAKLNSFIAWVSEAIKAKDEEINSIQAMSVYDYCSSVISDKYPEYVKPKCVSESEVLAKWNIKERNEYYMLEAQASTIGKFIHPKSVFSEARKEVNKKIAEPTVVTEQPNYVLVRNYVLSVPVNEIENAFFNLQKKYRTVSARLNQLKFKLKEEVRLANLAYAKEAEETNLKIAEQQKNIAAQFNKFQADELKKLGELKIAIPEALQEVFNHLQNL